MFPLSGKAQKGQFPVYDLQQKWLWILGKAMRGLVAMEKKRNLGPKSHRYPFLTYTQVVIFVKSDKLWHLVYGKPPGCTSTILDNLF